MWSLRVLLLLLSVLLGPVAAHQSLAKISMSRRKLCRMGGPKGFKVNCPGPCPNIARRWDVNKDNPALVLGRGQRVVLGTLRNNHASGFGRWSLVHVKDMMNHTAHARAAFRWDCAGAGRRPCSARNFNRDCSGDESGTYNARTVTIPRVYPDGVYVLGWVWFGGANRDGKKGEFGDYYDCSFVEVRGGASLAKEFTPQFVPDGPGSRDGKCLATVNRVGLCRTEPCKCRRGSPYTGLTRLMVPAEFEGKLPRPLYSWQFRRPYRLAQSAVSIRSMTLWRLRARYKLGKKIWETGTSWESRHPYLAVRQSMRLTVTCETEGNVREVVFYVDGILQGSKSDTRGPYSVAGNWKRSGTDFYAPWQAKIDGRVTSVSCKAVGKDGRAAWYSMELAKKMQGAA